MNRSLRSKLFLYMLLVIVVTGVVRIGVWLSYQAFEARRGHIVLHEEINELLLLALVEVLALLILGFMLWRLARVLLSPLRSIANASRLISQGRLEKRIRTEHLPRGELLEIAETLNASFNRYQEAIDRIAQFSSAASHQLRTPLTAIQTSAELCLAQAGSPEEYARTLEGILEETAHLGRMTEQLLTLSRMDVEHVRCDFKPSDLNHFARRVIDLYEPMLAAQRITVRQDLAPACALTGDETLLMEAVTNLFDNAVKACPDQGTIEVVTRHDGETAEFLIADSGPGIAPADRAEVFERFSRRPDTAYKGSGLGLSIVKEIVRLHDGQVTIEESAHGGAAFHLSLPAHGPNKRIP